MDPCKDAIVELPYHDYEPGWTAKLYQNFPEPSRMAVKCFGEVEKGHVEVHILFLWFISELPFRKYHVYCSSVLPERTVTFW